MFERSVGKMIPGYKDKSPEEVKEDLERVLELAAARIGKKKLSYEYLHDLTGFSSTTLQRWRKKHVKPREQDVEKLCNDLGIESTYFKLHQTLTEEDRIYFDNQERGDNLGLDPAFLEYLKSKKDINQEIGIMIEPSSEGYGEVKFQHKIPCEDEEIIKDGKLIIREKTPGRVEERYPDRTTALVILVIQSKVEELIRDSLSYYSPLLGYFPDESEREKIVNYLNNQFEELKKKKEKNQSMF